MAQGAPPCFMTIVSCFNKKSTDDKSGKANVAAHADSDVWGVLYAVPDGDLDKLDKGEGGYRRVRLSLRLMDNTSTDAWVISAGLQGIIKNTVAKGFALGIVREELRKYRGNGKSASSVS